MENTIEVGLLWFDDDPGKGLEEKVHAVAARYWRKFGEPPNVCFVHPATLGDNGKLRMVGNVLLKSRRTVLRNHFWVGVEKESHRG